MAEEKTIEELQSQEDREKGEEEQWKHKAQSWILSLPEGRPVTMSEVENWVKSNQSSLPSSINSLSQSELLEKFTSIQSSLSSFNQERQVNRGENPARFQRTDRWLPVYTWLESLDTDEVIKSKDIADWLSQNPKIGEELCSRHSRYHLMHYIKKCHVKILKRRGKIKCEPPQSNQHTSVNAQNDEVMRLPAPLSSKSLSTSQKDSGVYDAKRNEAFRKYELLVEFEKQLAAIVPNKE